MKTALERQAEKDRLARARIVAEDEQLEQKRVKRGPAQCCGAPAEPVASSKWAYRHRNGACFGDRKPCEQALACEQLGNRIHRLGWPSLGKVVEQRGQGGLSSDLFEAAQGRKRKQKQENELI